MKLVKVLRLLKSKEKFGLQKRGLRKVVCDRKKERLTQKVMIIFQGQKEGKVDLPLLSLSKCGVNYVIFKSLPSSFPPQMMIDIFLQIKEMCFNLVHQSASPSKWSQHTLTTIEERSLSCL